MFDQERERRMKEFRVWVHDLQADYIAKVMGEGLPKPTDDQFAQEVLGVTGDNLTRWKTKISPPGRENLEAMTVATHSIRPFEIFGRMKEYGDERIIYMLANWYKIPEHVKNDFAVKSEDKVIIK